MEAGKNRGKVTSVLDRGAGGQSQGRSHLRGDDHCQRRLAESRRARKQDVVGAGRTHPRGVEDELQLASNDALTHELRELLGAQRGLGCPLEFAGVGGDDAHRIDVETGIHLISHVRLPASRGRRAACRMRQDHYPRVSR